MTKVRRPRHLLFHIQEAVRPDVNALLHGVARMEPGPHAVALSPLTGSAYPLSRDELEYLFSVPSDQWTEALDPGAARSLARRGLLISDDEDDELVALRVKAERLDSSGWNLYAALYHFMTRWRDVDLRTGEEIGDFPAITEEMLREFVGLRGRPPNAFHALERSLGVHPLPLVRREGGLYAALASRRTTRGFARDLAMSEESLATVLYEVWGCRGTATMVDDLIALKRTSPSGGGMHPVEAYPIVRRVEGIEPGIYHYRSSDHALELIEPLTEDGAGSLAVSAVCGQAYLASAHVSIVLTARFDRLHWKYEKHQKAYASVLVDAGHLSQTLYLVAAELGLGAFVTLAVNSEPLKQRLLLDEVSEAVLAVAGCGLRPPERSPFEPDFTPYLPTENRG